MTSVAPTPSPALGQASASHKTLGSFFKRSTTSLKRSTSSLTKGPIATKIKAILVKIAHPHRARRSSGADESGTAARQDGDGQEPEIMPAPVAVAAEAASGPTAAKSRRLSLWPKHWGKLRGGPPASAEAEEEGEEEAEEVPSSYEGNDRSPLYATALVYLDDNGEEIEGPQ